MDPKRSEQRCPYCHQAVGDSALTLCPSCLTPHHPLCFNEGGCTVLGCEGYVSPERPARRPERPYRGLGRAVVICALFGLLALWGWTSPGWVYRHGVQDGVVLPLRVEEGPHVSCRLAEGHLWFLRDTGQGLEPNLIHDSQGFSWAWHEDGVRVQEVQVGSRAAELGLRAGDLITHLNQGAVGDLRASMAWGEHHFAWPELEGVERHERSVRLRGSERRPAATVRAFQATWLATIALLLAGVVLWAYRPREREEGEGAAPERPTLVIDPNAAPAGSEDAPYAKGPPMTEGTK